MRFKRLYDHKMQKPSDKGCDTHGSTVKLAQNDTCETALITETSTMSTNAEMIILERLFLMSSTALCADGFDKRNKMIKPITTKTARLSAWRDMKPLRLHRTSDKRNWEKEKKQNLDNAEAPYTSLHH